MVGVASLGQSSRRVRVGRPADVALVAGVRASVKLTGPMAAAGVTDRSERRIRKDAVRDSCRTA